MELVSNPALQAAAKTGKSKEREVGKYLEDEFGSRELTKLEHQQLRSAIKGGMDPVKALAHFGNNVHAYNIKGYIGLYGVPEEHDIIHCSASYPKGLIMEVRYLGKNGGSCQMKTTHTVYSFKKMLKKSFKGTAMIALDGPGHYEHTLVWLKKQEKKRLKCFTAYEQLTHGLRG